MLYGINEAPELMEAVEELYRGKPEDPIIAAYYADCLSLTGQDAADTALFFGNVIKSIKLLDEILEKHPENMEARLLRICQSCRLPNALFRRAPPAIKDMEYLIDEYENKRVELTADIYNRLLCLLGKAYLAIGLKVDAREAWEKVIRSDCTEEYKKLAEKFILEIKQSEQSNSATEPNRLKGDPKELYKKAKQLHELGKNGDTGAAREAVGILEKLHQENPGVAILEGYYGSSLALTGKNSADAQEFFGSAVKGLKHLDNAVSKSPDNAKLRYLRGNVCMGLPDAFFHLGEKTCEDFMFVINAYEKNKNLLTEDEFCKVLYDLGSCLKRLGRAEEAQRIRGRLVSEFPGSKYSRIISELERGV